MKDDFQMLDKVTRLESELHLVKDQLRLKTDEVEKEVLLKNSIHDDLVKARTMVRLSEFCNAYITYGFCRSCRQRNN